MVAFIAPLFKSSEMVGNTFLEPTYSFVVKLADKLIWQVNDFSNLQTTFFQLLNLRFGCRSSIYQVRSSNI